MIIPIDAHDNDFKDFLFYDIEVFKDDTIVVFKDYNGCKKVYHNEFDGMDKFIEGKILVGYNNYYYDDIILTKILLNSNQKEIKYTNDTLITGPSTKFYVHEELLTLDCFQQINVAKSSLKKVEANLGLSIDETAVPFDIDRPLNDKELKDTIRYCSRDVDATIDVFKLRWKTYFVPKISVVDMLRGVSKKMALRWNTTTITAQLLTEYEDENKKVRSKNIPKQFNLYKGNFYDVPKQVIDMWAEAEVPLRFRQKIKNKKCSVDMFECSFEFGFGGLHGVNKYQKKFKNVKLLDVASMYPNIIINLQALGPRPTQKYQQIVEKRLKAKAEGDIATANALKLVINSAYGLMKNEYSKLFNPIGGTNVCILGQISLFCLCQKLYEAGYTLVNINTDGVAFTGFGNRDFNEIKREWEEEHHLELELSEFKQWCQKDVNNYIAETKDGKVKVKGADVSKYNEPTEYTGDLLTLNAGLSWSSTNSLGIISKAVVDYVLYDIIPEKTVVNNTDNPILYQFVLQAGSTFKGTFDEEGREYQKVNRVFASNEGVNLVKVREDGATCKFPNAPEKMLVINEDLSTCKDLKDKIDIPYYIDLCREVCERWK